MSLCRCMLGIRSSRMRRQTRMRECTSPCLFLCPVFSHFCALRPLCNRLCFPYSMCFLFQSVWFRKTYVTCHLVLNIGRPITRTKTCESASFMLWQRSGNNLPALVTCMVSCPNSDDLLSLVWSLVTIRGQAGKLTKL